MFSMTGPGAASGRQVLKAGASRTQVCAEPLFVVARRPAAGGGLGEAGILPSPKPPIRAPPPGEVPAPGWSPPLVSLRSGQSPTLLGFPLDAAWSGTRPGKRHGLGAQRPSPPGPPAAAASRRVLNPLGAKARTSVGSRPRPKQGSKSSFNL